MRRLISLGMAAAILFGAYALTFGVPTAVSALIAPGTGEGTHTTAATSAGPSGARPAGRGKRSNTTTVVTAPLEMQPYESILNAIGTASSLRSVDIVSDSAGTVVEANLSANREVTEGDVLLRFDSRTEALNLEIAQANLQQASDTVTRYERLRQGGNSTVTDVTISDAQVALRLAEAAVGLAEVALDERSIPAPISGRLGLSDIQVGDRLSANDFIVNIDQADTLLVEFELPERAIGLLAEAKEVLVSTSAFTGKVITGEIISFDSRIDAVTRSVTVKARIDNSDALLWPGMTFAVRLLQESAPLPMIPSTAITWSRSGSSVWVDEGGTAKEVPVTILFRQNDSVWIDADIAEGTLVVTEGAHKLRAGSKISTAGGARNGKGRPPRTADKKTATEEPK
ncbi:efflux RND transporter periplasmic adaptor subunit (plasmid) [Pseudorhodobacter turbinis]|uniref:Efflux RND transporter periplasmic adaptor subunit n=1 Tax=Pseudorhodobacter turbinis TaxID=2500533 RepID=A0A4P8EJF3_9RHOB|nr:efflux RND transporter periplasmic adaptor subunit [Pseudorhodobacter turbinis]QCO57311.1 efflux RND transporter periplasmic adaptor subunit [Pseudorhodobacter turbinis]